MLFRGQNILGYKHYADDVVDEFVRLSIKNGIDVIRIFDALNDPRNLAQAVKSTKKYGGVCEVAMSYTISPVHTEEYFVNLALEYGEDGRGQHLHQGHGEPAAALSRPIRWSRSSSRH